MKKLLKWLFGLALLAIVLVVVFLLSLDSILRVLAEDRIHAQTGMDAEIGKFHVGLLEPEMTIQNLKLYNPPDFGGTPFLNIKEIHVEYDRDALRDGQIHVTLMRFNLGELDVVRNEAGQTNLFSLGVTLPAKDAREAGSRELAELKRRTGLDFAGIDVLNVSVGEARFIDLKNPRNDREQKIGIDNLIVKNVKSPADLAGVAVLIALRSGDFFTSVFGTGLNLN
jgi:uncharacterized protein involved in outer membrane biogenesis